MYILYISYVFLVMLCSWALIFPSEIVAKTFSGSLHKRKAIVTKKKSFGWITGVGISLYYSHSDVRLKLLAFRCGNMKWGLMCSDHGNSKKKKVFDEWSTGYKYGFLLDGGLSICSDSSSQGGLGTQSLFNLNMGSLGLCAVTVQRKASPVRWQV